MGFFDVLSDLASAIGNAIAGAVSSQGKTSCACCTKCQKSFRGGDYKRVFICSEEYYAKNVGIPILATKVDEIINCYPPCMVAGMYESFDPYNKEIPTEPNPALYDYENDWTERDREVNSDMSNDYYQE